MPEIQPTIEMDGKILVGDTWTLPESYIDDDIESGRLVALKGSTPVELPELTSTTEPTEEW